MTVTTLLDLVLAMALVALVLWGADHVRGVR